MKSKQQCTCNKEESTPVTNVDWLNDGSKKNYYYSFPVLLYLSGLDAVLVGWEEMLHTLGQCSPSITHQVGVLTGDDTCFVASESKHFCCVTEDPKEQSAWNHSGMCLDPQSHWPHTCKAWPLSQPWSQMREWQCLIDLPIHQVHAFQYWHQRKHAYYPLNIQAGILVPKEWRHPF